ncbi:Gfo/Idh/MocA family oxidoreductase [Pseudomonas gingeri]|uniref:Gfo/Idh/MocA family protein n=1 Tax=Pseudomonas gingeri TaxID=117681 RepID=UPI00159FDA1E|nr:Gfo/Idh/MocA family oxidoreductase [Pseudomonas gingeri]NVZ24423.1 Gfo/Idh/MocA family oxidoreductase [Pseudomonas gingeri]
MRIGLVGYGHGGRYFHGPLLASLAGATFVGVVSRDAGRRRQLAADHPGLPAFDSLAQLVEAGVDIAVICTPLAGRRELILEAIARGIGVVSDKPFAVDAREAEELIRAARDKGVLLSVYQNRRWDSDFLTVRKLIAANALGRISRFESRMERYAPATVGDPGGGGILRDFGSHLVDQALQLFGPVARVYAEVDFLAAHAGLDDDFFLSLTHRNGVVSHLWGNAVQNLPGPRFRVTGDSGSYSVDGLDVQSEAVLGGRSPKTEGERWGVEEHRNWGWFERGSEREKVPSERGNWPQFYRQLQEAVAGRGPVPVLPREALETTRVLDAARLSAQEARVVWLD